MRQNDVVANAFDRIRHGVIFLTSVADLGPNGEHQGDLAAVGGVERQGPGFQALRILLEETPAQDLAAGLVVGR